jgi:hypothetical protein
VRHHLADALLQDVVLDEALVDQAERLPVVSVRADVSAAAAPLAMSSATASRNELAKARLNSSWPSTTFFCAVESSIRSWYVTAFLTRNSSVVATSGSNVCTTPRMAVSAERNASGRAWRGVMSA